MGIMKQFIKALDKDKLQSCCVDYDAIKILVKHGLKINISRCLKTNKY
jgi:hypothetical protein